MSSSFILAILFFQCLVLPAFTQAPMLPDPGTLITDEEFNATYTHLIGFEGCLLPQQRSIIQAFWDSAAVLNRINIRNSQIGDVGINWQQPPAIEYLGSPFSQPRWGNIQSSFFKVYVCFISWLRTLTDLRLLRSL